MKFNLLFRSMIVSLMAAAVTGCGQPKETDPADTVQAIHALCQINAGTQVVVCIDYAVDSLSNNDLCATTEITNYRTQGADGHLYTGVGNVATTGCGMQEAALPLLGSCFLAGSDIRYYAMWNAANAKDNCTSRSGTWH